MRYGKVAAVLITGFRNVIFNQGDEVNENQFPVGTFDELVKNKSITITREDEVTARPPLKDEVEFHYADEGKEEIPQGIKERMESMKQELDAAQVTYDKEATFEELSELIEKQKESPQQPEKTPAQKEAEHFDDTTRKEIMAELDALKVTYPKNASKQELYTLWRQNKK